jgi:predicted PurR-regulated permease PerM
VIQDRARAQDTFIVVLTLAALVATLKIIAPFYGSLIMAIIACILLRPLYRWTETRFKRRSRTFHALLTDLLVFAFVVIPIGLLLWAAINEADAMRPLLQEWGKTIDALREGRMTESLQFMRPLRGLIARATGTSALQVQTWIFQSVSGFIDAVAAAGSAIAGRVLTSAVDLFFFFFALFFLLRDGSDYYQKMRNILPLPPKDQDRIFARLHLSILAIVRGWFLSALAQGTAATVGFLLIGFQPAVLLGVMAALASILPVGGTAFVWGPVAIFLLVKGATVKGLFLLGWGLGMVGTIDNLLAPYLMGHRVHLPLLFLLFAILGGVSVFGVIGLILGPLLLSITPTVLDIFRHRFLTAR